VELDFTQDLRGAFAEAKKRHFATITDPDKIGRLPRDISRYDGSPAVKFGIQILPCVFTRPGELRRAE
jgi:hypothetical protein